jgi:hypothetical protein
MSPSAFSAYLNRLQEDEKKGGGGGGKPKMQVSDKGRPLRFGRTMRQSSGIKGKRFLAGKRINSIVKAKYVANNRDSRRHIVQHMDYILNRERGEDEPERKFFDRKRDDIPRDEAIQTMMSNRGDKVAMYKIMLSPGENSAAKAEELRIIMEEWRRLSGLYLQWIATEHKNTDHHHFHITLAGRDENGQGYVLKPGDLDLLRDIANGRQWELQDRDEEFEKQIEQELGLDYEDALRLFDRWEGEKTLEELGLPNKRIDQDARDLIGDAKKGLLMNTAFDVDAFRRSLESQILQTNHEARELLGELKAEKDLQNGIEDAISLVQRNPNFDPAKFVESLQKDLADESKKLEHGELTKDVSRPEHEAYKALFKVSHPEIALGDGNYSILRDIQEATLEQHPYLKATYKPALAPYYESVLKDFLKEHPELKDTYKIDPKDPSNNRDAVLERFLEDHPQLAPELIDPKYVNQLEKQAQQLQKSDVSERPYKSQDIDVDKVHADDKFDAGGKTWTKYHSLDELREVNEALNSGDWSRIPKSDYQKLGKFITAKELSGENIYGLPPGIDPERVDEAVLEKIAQDHDQKRIEAIKQSLLAYNTSYEKLTPEPKSPVEILKEQMEKIGEHFPELIPDFVKELADRFHTTLDQFPEFLPGNEHMLATNMADLYKQVDLDLAKQQQEQEKDKQQEPQDRSTLFEQLKNSESPLTRDDIEQLDIAEVRSLLRTPEEGEHDHSQEIITAMFIPTYEDEEEQEHKKEEEHDIER